MEHLAAPIYRDTEELLVLDFDYTLACTDRLQEMLEMVVETVHAKGDADRLRAARQATPRFDTVDFLQTELGLDATTLERIRRRFIEEVSREGKEQFFEDGAEKLLAEVRVSGQPFVIMTTGGQWQSWKLAALGVDGDPYHITSGRDKSHQLLATRRADGRYELDNVTNLPDGAVGYRFARFVLADDRDEAFALEAGEPVPADVKGFLVTHARFESKRPSGVDYPPHVVVSLGLGAVRHYVEQMYRTDASKT